MSIKKNLENMGEIFEERQKMYGDNYLILGNVLHFLFPKGISINGPKQFSRFAMFFQVLLKVTRYASMYNKGGHPDSLDDMAVYAAILKEVDKL